MRMSWTNQRNGRYYSATLERDLFNDWIITKTWGSTPKRSHRRQIVYCEQKEKGIELLKKIEKRRYKHGYCVSNEV